MIAGTDVEHRMPPTTVTVLRWTALVVLLAATVVLGVLPRVFGSDPVTVGSVLETLAFWYLVPGLVVMAKRPWHQVGWWLILIGLGLTPIDLAWDSTAGPLADGGGPAAWLPWAAWLSTWGGYFGYAAVIGLLVVFPDGLADRSRRDRHAGRAMIGVAALLTLLAMGADPVATNGIDDAVYPNPLGLRIVPLAVADYGYLLVFALLTICVVWMWRRRRDADPLARDRYTLVLYAFGLLVASLVLGITLFEVIGDLAWIPAYLGWYLVPIAFTVAVVRRGLYGVDRLVRRTVTFGVVAVLIGLVYVASVFGLAGLAGGSSDLVVAAATLAAAAVVNPVRRRVHMAVERRFDRARYDAEREIDRFSTRLRTELDLPSMLEALAGLVDRTLAPASTSVWIRRPGSARTYSGRRPGMPA